MDSSGWENEQMTGCYEDGNEISFFYKGGYYFD